ncbi:MAG TPA: MgtC/SapB family protein [Polyangiaceae bacterium]|jgi:putative Mg2+ transporter-C (MgtC) family protein|nr:MgtC/SapB family protein [Polyangiaceae bacterium]
MIGHAELVARIAIGSAFGGVIGYERDRHRRPVGFRTHMIVAMAAATFMVISSQFVFHQHYAEHDLVEVDSSRIAASVVSGIGFLAGGAILRTGMTIQGLTTAAGLWLVTAIGMCAGAGMYFESAVVTLFGIVALTVLRRFEDKNVVRRRVAVVLSETERLEELMAGVRKLGAEVSNVEYEHRLDEKKRVEVTLDVDLDVHVGLVELVGVIEAIPGVRRVHVLQHA